MQATVASYEPTTGRGTVLLDDGVQIAFPAEALAGAHLRHLRSGQRVIVTLDQTSTPPTVEALRIH